MDGYYSVGDTFLDDPGGFSFSGQPGPHFFDNVRPFFCSVADSTLRHLSGPGLVAERYSFCGSDNHQPFLQKMITG